MILLIPNFQKIPHRKNHKNASKYHNKKNIIIQKSRYRRNPNPVIGILTQPSPYLEFPKEQYSHIASAYIKGIEAAGGQVIPIKYDDSYENINNILNGINGILLPGGGTNLKEFNATTKKREYTKYGKIAKYLLFFAKKENKLGRYYPVWGTCLGFELILMAHAGRKQVINKVFGMVNHVDKLTFIQVI